MSYKETLDLCDKYQIDKYDIEIANEVEFFFINEGGRYRPDFEQLCELTAEAFSKVDCYISLSAVVQSLYKLVVKDRRDINSLDRYEIVGNIENY